ncbi:hypothetical protein ALT1000_430008 [Alteromonas macleodii]
MPSCFLRKAEGFFTTDVFVKPHLSIDLLVNYASQSLCPSKKYKLCREKVDNLSALKK